MNSVYLKKEIVVWAKAFVFAVDKNFDEEVKVKSNFSIANNPIAAKPPGFAADYFRLRT